MVMCPNSSQLNSSIYCWLLSSCWLVMLIPFIIHKEKEEKGIIIIIMPLFDHCYIKEAKVNQLKEYFRSILVTLGRQ